MQLRIDVLKFLRCIRSRIRLFCVSSECDEIKHDESKKRHVSHLLCSGRDASGIYLAVSPNLNPNHIIENSNEVVQLIKSRGIFIDIQVLAERLKIIKKLQVKIKNFKESESEIGNELNKLSDVEKSSLQGSELIKKQTELRIKSKMLTKRLWDLEDAAFPDLLKIPNTLHPDVTSENKVINQCGRPNEFQFTVKAHTELGKLNRCLKFTPFHSYYLLNKAAKLEFALTNYFTDRLTEAGFVNVIGPDFCKQVTLEGCGEMPEDICRMITVEKEGQSYYVTGNASLPSFIAPLARTLTNKSSLPLCYFNIGRYYKSPNSRTDDTLFTVCQDVIVKTLISTLPSEFTNQFSRLCEIIERCYREIGIPFQTVQVSSCRLERAENLRREYELWSAHKNEFVTVGHISICTDYISKRLMIKYGKGKISENYVYIIESTIASLPTLIGCIMENMQTIDGTFSIPDVLIPYF
ncbi:uncharacterized protein LOC111638818 [Centruroides sculpturatus]|uniref:uncharacterized protein LOC111638818 n=1 Tax=Centruroides sculpturatus TaxID=218467 RepID=UPI000C6E4BC0|nr:uncharacterized protein LOC111638818 [Centruroides sculpturatus]